MYPQSGKKKAGHSDHMWMAHLQQADEVHCCGALKSAGWLVQQNISRVDSAAHGPTPLHNPTQLAGQLASRSSCCHITSNCPLSNTLENRLVKYEFMANLDTPAAG
jgi:hypothetical protein